MSIDPPNILVNDENTSKFFKHWFKTSPARWFAHARGGFLALQSVPKIMEWMEKSNIRHKLIPNSIYNNKNKVFPGFYREFWGDCKRYYSNRNQKKITTTNQALFILKLLDDLGISYLQSSDKLRVEEKKDWLNAFYVLKLGIDAFIQIKFWNK